MWPFKKKQLVIKYKSVSIEQTYSIREYKIQIKMQDGTEHVMHMKDWLERKSYDVSLVHGYDVRINIRDLPNEFKTDIVYYWNHLIEDQVNDLKRFTNHASVVLDDEATKERICLNPAHIKELIIYPPITHEVKKIKKDIELL